MQRNRILQFNSARQQRRDDVTARSTTGHPAAACKIDDGTAHADCSFGHIYHP
jgi:hypothetical protein